MEIVLAIYFGLAGYWLMRTAWEGVDTSTFEFAWTTMMGGILFIIGALVLLGVIDITTRV